MVQRKRFKRASLAFVKKWFDEYSIASYPLLAGAILWLIAVGFDALGDGVVAGISAAIGLIIATLGILTYLVLLIIDLLNE